MPVPRPLLDRRAVLAGVGAFAATPLFAAMSKADLAALYARADAELQTKTSAHVGTWHMDKSRWAVDLDAGTITFTNPRGWVVTAPVQVIGTRSSRDGTWLWAWDNPSIPAASTASARQVRDYGRAQGIAELTDRKFVADEKQCWRLTSLMCLLTKANGAYRGPSGEAAVFMTFGTISIKKR